jgi:plastocyanin
MKRAIALVGLAALFATLPASAGSLQNTVRIRHQVQGCHTWSANGGAFRAHPIMGVARGALVTFTNNDIMRHALIQTSGPRVTIGHAQMGKIGAHAYVTFTKAGVYGFTTKFGEDYPGMEMETHGPDNVLTLRVIVR